MGKAEDFANGVIPEDETLWERRSRVLTMRNAGATYQAIAKQLNISTATARNDLRKALREVISETAEDMLARQRSVLMDLQRVNYPAALGGDKDAQGMVLRVLEHEAKLFGLYAPSRVAVGVTDVEFAEQAASLIKDLGLEPPSELVRGLGGAQDPVVEAEVVEPPDPDFDPLVDDTAPDETDPADDGWTNLN